MQPTCRHTFQCISTKYTKDKWRLGCWKPNFWGACHQPFLKIFSFTSSLTNLNALVQLQTALQHHSTGDVSGVSRGLSEPEMRRYSIVDCRSGQVSQMSLLKLHYQQHQCKTVVSCCFFFTVGGDVDRQRPVHSSRGFATMGNPWSAPHVGFVVWLQVLMKYLAALQVRHFPIHRSILQCWIIRFQPIDHLRYRKKWEEMRPHSDYKTHQAIFTFKRHTSRVRMSERYVQSPSQFSIFSHIISLQSWRLYWLENAWFSIL